MHDTIAAISTAFGEAAISVLRLSGEHALQVAQRVFKGKRVLEALEPRVQHFGNIVDGEGGVVDSVLLTHFRAPASYTGDDVVEISCHGGILVTRRIFELLLHHGARAAEAGEFTQRAFVNGKMDLTQAEAVMDLIHAQSELALKAATQQLEGRLGKESEHLRADLIELLAHVEAYIDFPDEDIDPDTGAAMQKRLASIQLRVGSLLDTAHHGRILRSGARTVICGEPNVGKSSLLNLLSGFDRAIVSAEAGTTRDTIEEVLHIHGLPFVLVDTAGIREGAGSIEQSGIDRTNREMARADVILEVVDGSLPRDAARRVPGLEDRRGYLLILNKSDLGLHPSWLPDVERGAILLSCENQEGLDPLRAAMRDAVWTGAGAGNSHMVAINARHQACFQRAAEALVHGAAALKRNEAPEFVAVFLREAMEAVGEVTGRVDVEEILGAIFSRFCIGK
ncbi:tRNA uridine-5-carboxymethylaminomethyl(34) synthesis GTPase MnmE [Verrucomicrobium sp. BvORR034]|jgi:tRNA modification GTPase|uniref:tRNA uridine-5-carboxymethylaminomethyl(34) synthesis GTPase MnmE n=1 Tax=Verrucomicrobium sp. BvORR034 TaxID=1396418 RepID=UPI0006785E44|nr:tRNA uridine-5-carboxymethylaminomethyl(34) synthesis GTPase MnmE [Verrucomicrobium sp. BvORR034]